jgi:hypothetical protein
MALCLQPQVAMLSVTVGYKAVWGVIPALHTPLMSVSNAISGGTPNPAPFTSRYLPQTGDCSQRPCLNV